MARVKLTTGRSGPNGSFGSGEIVDVSDKEALRMVKAGRAVPAKAKPETAKIARSPNHSGGGDKPSSKTETR